MGVLADLGAKVNMRKRAIRMDPDIVEDIGTKWGDKRNGVSFKVWDAGDETKEVAFNKLLLRNPKLFSAVVDDYVLVQVVVDNVSTSRGVEEIGEEVFYRYFWE